MLRHAGALARSTHPGPSLAVSAVAALLGLAVGLEPWRVAVLGLAVLFDQVSVGLSNDWIDADRDRAVGRIDKPVARGDIAVDAARAAAWISAAVALLLTVPLGLGATAVHAVALASAWAYNAALKNSPLSVLPYAVSFGLLPSIASLARPAPALPAWWVFAAGALLGVAAHFANVLPDLDDDRRTGIRGLPHRLGLRTSIVITWVALALGAAAVTVGVASGSGGIPVFADVGLLISVVISALGTVLALQRGVGRWLFRLVIVAALVDVTMLVLAGTRMLA
ncbi:MAG TPA: UbiA family prenyltransferase [Pseudolysinimonas sp.]|nr:UbiA family prenyltransferase [Pseudolysinimonas sp.]